MGSTVHFSSGRGFESSARCRSLESWASFNSYWFCLLSVVCLSASLLFDLSTFDKVMCIIQSVLWSLISLFVNKVAIRRRMRDPLELFLITLSSLTVQCLILLTAELYMWIKYGEKQLVCAAFKSGALKQTVAYFFETNFVDTLTDSTRKTIVLVYIGVLTAVFLLALNAIVQTIRLWREYSKEAREADDAWMLENESYSTTIARSDGARVLVNVDVKVEESGDTIKTSK